MCLCLPCCALATVQLARNRAEVRRVAALAARAGAARGAVLARRALGSAWDEATSLPGLVMYATGTQLADAAGAGPALRRALRAAASDAAVLPEALAVATLDAAAALRDAASTSPAAVAALLALLAKDAAAFPAALSEALGVTPLADLMLDVLRGEGGAPSHGTLRMPPGKLAVIGLADGTSEGDADSVTTAPARTHLMP